MHASLVQMGTCRLRSRRSPWCSTPAASSRAVGPADHLVGVLHTRVHSRQRHHRKCCKVNLLGFICCEPENMVMESCEPRLGASRLPGARLWQPQCRHAKKRQIKTATRGGGLARAAGCHLAHPVAHWCLSMMSDFVASHGVLHAARNPNSNEQSAIGD